MSVMAAELVIRASWRWLARTPAETGGLRGDGHAGALPHPCLPAQVRSEYPARRSCPPARPAKTRVPWEPSSVVRIVRGSAWIRISLGREPEANGACVTSKLVAPCDERWSRCGG